MQCLQDARLSAKLAFLSPTNQAHLLRYMDALTARQYARSTVEAIVTVLKRLLRHLPPALSTSVWKWFCREVGAAGFKSDRMAR